MANIFTPNGDNINDNFIIHGRPGVIIETFNIYDRWGKLVFVSSNFPAGDLISSWNGTTQGEKAITGVYAYHLNILLPDGNRITHKGSFSLIR